MAEPKNDAPLMDHDLTACHRCGAETVGWATVLGRAVGVCKEHRGVVEIVTIGACPHRQEPGARRRRPSLDDGTVCHRCGLRDELERVMDGDMPTDALRCLRCDEVVKPRSKP